MADPIIEPASSLQKIINRIGRMVGADPDADVLANEKIRDNLQDAVNLFCNSRQWSFLRTDGSFSLVSGTATYNIRTVDTASMADFLAPAAFLDANEKPIRFMPYSIYLKHYAYTDSTAANPDNYYHVSGYTYGFYPEPASTNTVYVHYIRQHPDVTIPGATLLVPSYGQSVLAYIAAQLYRTEDGAALANVYNDKTIQMMIVQAAAQDTQDGDLIHDETIRPQGHFITTRGTGANGEIEAP